MPEIEQNIDREIIKSENFSKESLEKHSFTGCTFNSCDFSETILRNVKFNRALSRIAISVL
ncbi:pentapeptide repeat-containing protein [Candidatus Protochlamydia sp. R18]|uniref:pentapeptide repeat-containing protein n=1 Tax=Candidatus Protochlamydia sp. R18 TaxID=1353977 RepID=UPI0009AEDB36